MYTDNFEEEILFIPARKDGEACNHLKIVTAFTDVERISSHLIKLFDGRNKEYVSGIKVDIILGMTKGTGLTLKKHDKICSLIKRLNSVSGMPQISCNYIVEGKQVHSKVYVWCRGRKAIEAFKEELNIGKHVFVTLGGDTGKSEVDWVPGFIGVAHVIREPYDFGYNGKEKYFKFDIEVDCVFEKPFKREDFLSYREAYDAPYIGPELSRDPSQALSTLDKIKAVAVIRAVLDEFPEMLEKFKEIFDREFMDRVLGAVTVMIPTSVKFGESKEDAVNSIQEEMSIENEGSEEEEMESKPYIEPDYYTGCSRKNKDTGTVYAHNRIVFGAPGTGKSFKLNDEQKDLISEGGEYERVTFHPDYSYANFVGTYKPVPTKNGISYEYVPGPFMRTYVKAIENGQSDNKEDVKPFLLLIEEINRANVAAVFGEVFQLLDRDDRNASQYPVKPSEDIKAYLAKELGGKPEQYDEIKIPDNMYIWSTMNSADQGVFPMDTAFKRRWNFEYIGINNKDEKINDT